MRQSGAFAPPFAPGADTMRNTLLSWLPDDLGGARVLDAGCGTGAMTVEPGAARSERLRDRHLADPHRTRPGACAARSRQGTRDLCRWRHARSCVSAASTTSSRWTASYTMTDRISRARSRGLAARTRSSIVFTVAPRTFALSVMHAAGRLFPRANRAPAIPPISQHAIERRLATQPGLKNWRLGRASRVDSGFYISQALEVVCP